MSTLTVTNIKATGETTSRAVSGVAAAWLYANTTTSIQDSINISSGTDNGTGDYQYAITNSFSNALYSITHSCRVSSTNAFTSQHPIVATGTLYLNTIQTSNNLATDRWHAITAHGDLA